MDEGGGQRSTYRPFLCHGLRPKLVHDGNEMQQSGQVNHRVRACGLDRGIIGGFFHYPSDERAGNQMGQRLGALAVQRDQLNGLYGRARENE
jgi:hypothetical protein